MKKWFFIGVPAFFIVVISVLFFYFRATYQVALLKKPFTQIQVLEKDVVLASIKNGADYIAQTILDREGQSRCDFEMQSRTWKKYEEAWHTGQMILALLEADSLLPKNQYLQKALFSGAWWKSLEIEEGPLKGFLNADHGDDMPGIALFSTVSDGSHGLFRLSEKSEDPSYAEVATHAAEFLLREMPGTRPGHYLDNVDLEEKKILRTQDEVENRNELKKTDNPYFERVNIEGSLFLDAYLFSKNEKFLKAFKDQCEATVLTQNDQGIWMSVFPNNIETGYIHPRFNLWHAEALLRCYDQFKDEKYMSGAIKTAEHYARYQLPDGSLDLAGEKADKDKDLYSGSAVAFAGIIWLEISRKNAQHDYKENAKKAALWLVNHQYPLDYKLEEVRGGFKDLKIRSGKNEILNRDLGTSFGVRFLAKYYQTEWP